MRVEIKIPELGESVNEATISQILKENGSLVQMDEEVVELETDKVNQVLSAPQAGQLHLEVALDDTVQIGQVIGYVETQSEVKAEETPPKAPEKAEEAPAAPKEEAPQRVEAKPAPPTAEPKPALEPAKESGAVRRMEAEFVADVKEEKREEERKQEPKPSRSETRTRMSKIRRVIAERLVEAQSSAAMLTTFNEVDLTHVMAIRKTYKDAFIEKHGVKLGLMSWFVKACVIAMEAVPEINSYIDGDEIVYRNYYDIGIAVGTERGLMVPVVRSCDQLSFAEIESQIIQFAKSAREGKISVDDLRGGGFTITNGGIYGSLLSTPILNPPQSGILGMHKIQSRPMDCGGEIKSRPMMYLALSYDHRIVDGQGAVTFLVRIKEVLEDPARFLLEL